MGYFIQLWCHDCVSIVYRSEQDALGHPGPAIDNEAPIRISSRLSEVLTLARVEMFNSEPAGDCDLAVPIVRNRQSARQDL
jgi:hypothetical protein